MAVVNYGIYKISLNLDSEKTQGLRTGDIVRRQFFTGTNVIYSLMCVLSYGVDEIMVDVEHEDGTTSKVKKAQPWFIGALLEGDEPVGGEILDFARVTNLFDTNRSGALYLTASDEYSPYMDVIDGIGRNCSLCWPENLLIPDSPDAKSQYNVEGGSDITCDYQRSLTEYNRILHIHRDDVTPQNVVRLRQEFYEYLDDTQTLIVSYKIRKTGPEIDIPVSIGYQSRTNADDVAGSRTDGCDYVHVTEDWEYKVHVISIENSGRHLRDFRMDFSELGSNQDVYISDFNIIRLSSLANFGDASQIRVGKLDGISDPVFGKLDSYGGYFQKLFATTSAHISGTLTAGDENGFAATFYAGKIHKNAFVNSLEPHADKLPISGADLLDIYNLQNPTGIGNVYEVSRSISMTAQSKDNWVLNPEDKKIGKIYTFSFWMYCMCVGQFTVLQNAKIIGTIQIPHSQTMGWHRHKVTFKLLDSGNEDVILSIVAEFQPIGDDADEKRLFFFTSPQLEAGRNVTQYQPTDDTILADCEDYGAWFNRGGIGGTIQNPLLQLNADGEGAIETRSHSLRINQDGSGYLANHGITWDDEGNVLFGPNVHINWDNLGTDTKHNLENKNVRIVGGSAFAVMGSTDAGLLYAPDFIQLQLEETGMNQNASGRKWYYQENGQYIQIDSNLNDANTLLTIYPTDSYWNKAKGSLVIRVVDTFQGKDYVDTITIHKYFMEGYKVEIISSKGDTFKNGNVNTTLTAQVYYQGELVSEEFITEYFKYQWHKYQLPDLENEVPEWWVTEEYINGQLVKSYTPTNQKTLIVSGVLSGTEVYVCEILSKSDNYFPYNFPITF